MSDQEYTPGEIARALVRIETKVNELAKSVVSKEVYASDKEATKERFGRIEADVEKGKSSARGAWRTAITSFVAPLVVALVVAWIVSGGGGVT